MFGDYIDSLEMSEPSNKSFQNTDQKVLQNINPSLGGLVQFSKHLKNT